jgi:hypothetical protein
MCSFDTTEADVDAFAAAISQEMAASGVFPICVVVQINLGDQSRDVIAEPYIAVGIRAQDPVLGVIVAQRKIEPPVQAASDLACRCPSRSSRSATIGSAPPR